MNKAIITIVLAIVLQPIFLLMMELIVSLSTYVCQEINHSVRKFIHEVKYIFSGLR